MGQNKGLILETFEGIWAQGQNPSFDLVDFLTKKYFLGLEPKNLAQQELGFLVEQNMRSLVDLALRTIEEEVQEKLAVQNLTHDKQAYFEAITGLLLIYYVWVRIEEDAHLAEHFEAFYLAVMKATMAYGIIDHYCDNALKADEYIYLAQQLIQEYEAAMFAIFGLNEANYALLNALKRDFHQAEFKEKACLGQTSVYTLNQAEACGHKALHLFFIFGLFLLRLGQASRLGAYQAVYLKLAAVIQIFDDIGDFDEDLENGHFSYPYLLYQSKFASAPLTRAALLSNQAFMRDIRQCLLDLIQEAEQLAETAQLDVFPFKYLVQALKARVFLFTNYYKFQTS